MQGVDLALTKDIPEKISQLTLKEETGQVKEESLMRFFKPFHHSSKENVKILQANFHEIFWINLLSRKKGFDMLKKETYKSAWIC